MELFRMTLSDTGNSYKSSGRGAIFICKDEFNRIVSLPKRVKDIDIVAFDEPWPDRVRVQVDHELGYRRILIDGKELTFGFTTAGMIRRRVAEHGPFYVEVQYE